MDEKSAFLGIENIKKLLLNLSIPVIVGNASQNLQDFQRKQLFFKSKCRIRNYR